MLMRDRRIAALFLFFAFLLLLIAASACGTKTVVVTETVTASPGAENAGTSSGDSPSAMQIVTELKKAGLPIGKTIEYDEKTDPNDLLGRPGKYTQKVNWADLRLRPPSSDPYSSGTIEVFDSTDDATSRKEYIEALGQAFSDGWYTFLQGDYLLRVSYDLTPEQAAVYEKALQEILQNGAASPVPNASVSTVPSPKPLQVVESGWVVSGKYLYYGLTVHNPNEAFAARFVHTATEMTNGDGSVLGVKDDTSVWILPGETIALGGMADPHGKRPAKVKFSASVTEDDWVLAEDTEVPAPSPLKISKVRASQDELGYWIVTGIVTNPGESLVDSLNLTAIAKSPSGKVLFGLSNFLRNLPANGSKPFELRTYWQSSQPVESVEVYAQPQRF